MGKNKRRKRDQAMIELSERLRDLERRLNKRSRHNHAGEFFHDTHSKQILRNRTFKMVPRFLVRHFI